MIIAEKLKAAELRTDDYHGHPALAYSQLDRCGVWTEDEMQWTPHMMREPIEQTDAMSLGTLLHTAWYEKRMDIAVRPVNDDGSLVRADSKAFKAWSADNAGKTIITPKDAELLRGMIVALESSDMIRRYDVKNALILSTEQAYVTTWAMPVEVRIKPDRLRMSPDGYLICEDLKTTRAANPMEFRRECEPWGHNYYRRYAFYRRVLSAITGLEFERIRCVMMCVQNVAPHATFMCELDPEKLDIADLVNENCIAALAKCIAANDFKPSWIKGPVVI